jgi:hypothetical protein
MSLVQHKSRQTPGDLQLVSLTYQKYNYIVNPLFFFFHFQPRILASFPRTISPTILIEEKSDSGLISGLIQKNFHSSGTVEGIYSGSY